MESLLARRSLPTRVLLARSLALERFSSPRVKLLNRIFPLPPPRPPREIGLGSERESSGKFARALIREDRVAAELHFQSSCRRCESSRGEKKVGRINTTMTFFIALWLKEIKFLLLKNFSYIRTRNSVSLNLNACSYVITIFIQPVLFFNMDFKRVMLESHEQKRLVELTIMT